MSKVTGPAPQPSPGRATKPPEAGKRKGPVAPPPTGAQLAEMLAHHAELIPADVVAEALRRESRHPGTLLGAIALTGTGQVLGLPDDRIEQAVEQFVHRPAAVNLRQVQVNMVVDTWGLPEEARAAGISANELMQVQGSLAKLCDDGTAARDPETYRLIKKLGFKAGLGEVAKGVAAVAYGVDRANFQGLTINQVMGLVGDAQRRKQDDVIYNPNFWKRAKTRWGRGGGGRPGHDRATRQPPKATDPHATSVQTLPGDDGKARVVMEVKPDLSFKIVVYDANGKVVGQRTGYLAFDGLTVCASPDDPTRALPVYFPVNSLCGLREPALPPTGGATARGRMPGPLGGR